MKRMMALLLAACMLLLAIPAVAEEDVSGKWYVVMIGLTVADFDLRADGTCTLSASSDGEEVSGEGTWTQEGDKINIEVNGNSMPLSHEGDSLQFDMEALAAMGLDVSSMSAGMDASLFSSLIQISREPGIVTAAEFTAYQENGTLPEGKTEEDMQAVQAGMMMAFFSLMGSADVESADGSAVETGTTEDGNAVELTVVEDNFYLREGYGGQEGIYIAKVQNDQEEPVYLYEGSLTLLDAEENEAGKAEYMYTTGSRYLEPGEATFISFVADVNDGAAADHYAVQLTPSSVSYQTPDRSIDVSAAELRIEEGYFTNYYTAVTITNTAEAAQPRINAIAAVRDSEGRLMGLTSSGLYQNELAAGSTITLVDSLDSRVTDYCENNGITLGQVEAYAWIDTY